MMQPNCLNFIETNNDWNKFVVQVSDNTGDHYENMWLENAKANKSLIKNCGWACDLQDAHSGKTAVLLGASPAIKKQTEKLRNLRMDPDFVFIGITSGLKFVLSEGIKPHYVMIADADPAMKRFWEDMDMSLTKNMTLVANICTHPDLLEMWQGDIKFLAIYTAIKKLDRKFKKWFPNYNGCGIPFPALSSQYNTGTAWANLVLGCKTIIFVGNELSFPDKESPYYPDRKDVKDGWVRKPHIDIYGETVYTNYMLMSLKMALEDFLGKLSGDSYFLNATEAGIFGVSRRYGNLSWISQLTLSNAIMQANHIKRYGEPYYDEPLIKTPTIRESVLYGA